MDAREPRLPLRSVGKVNLPFLSTFMQLKTMKRSQDPKYYLTNTGTGYASLWKLLLTYALPIDETSSVLFPKNQTGYMKVIPGTENKTITSTLPTTFDQYGWRTDEAIMGTFAAGTWTFSVIIGAGKNVTGNITIYVRLWRSTSADGSGATAVTDWLTIGIVDAPVANGYYTRSNSFSLSALSLSNEYLFAEYALGTTSACGAAAGCAVSLGAMHANSYIITSLLASERILKENLSTISEKLISVLTKVPMIRAFTENLSVIQDLVVRTIAYSRKLEQNLSVIRDVFSFVYTPLAIPVRYFKENLSIIGAKFSRVVSYNRVLSQRLIISDVLKRFVGFPRVFMENLSVLKAVFARSVNFLRRLVDDLSVLKDVFSSILVPLVKAYKFVQQVIIQALVIRKIQSLRRLPQVIIIRDIFSFIYTPLVKIYRFVQNLSVISDVPKRAVAYTRRQIQETFVSALFKRILTLIRRFRIDLSVLTEILVRRLAYVRKLVQTVLVQNVFKRIIRYVRRLPQQIIVSDIFRRTVGFPRKFVEDLSALTDMFIRRIAYLRRLPQNLSVIRDVFSFIYTAIIKVYRLVQTIFIQTIFSRKISYVRKIANVTSVSDIFKRTVGFPRKLVQNLSVLKTVLLRRVAYSRRLVLFTYIQDKFSYVYVPIIRVYRFIQSLVISTLFQRRVDLTRRLRQDLSVLQDLFSSVYTPIVRVYRFIQNLSALRHVFRYELTTSLEEVVRRKFVQAQSELQDLYEKAKKKAKFYLGR